jgi:hypothetical protein
MISWACAGHQAAQDDLGDGAAAQQGVEVGAVEGARVVFGDAQVGWLGAEFVDDGVPSGRWQRGGRREFVAAARGVGEVGGERDVDYHDRQAVRAEGIRELRGACHDLGAGGGDGRGGDDAGLQVDQDECGLRVESGQCRDSFDSFLPCRPERSAQFLDDLA